uniref:Glucuronosyltransferase n=1 Tax=Parascaris univalens TaxID=6257 RepID=A0A915CDR2_PARUN
QMGVLLLCAFSLFIVSVDTSEILVGVMTQGKSHTGSFMPLLEELKGQGHNVTLFMDSYVNISFGNKVNEWFIKITGGATEAFIHCWIIRKNSGTHC